MRQGAGKNICITKKLQILLKPFIKAVNPYMMISPLSHPTMVIREVKALYEK